MILTLYMQDALFNSLSLDGSSKGHDFMHSGHSFTDCLASLSLFLFIPTGRVMSHKNEEKGYFQFSFDLSLHTSLHLSLLVHSCALHPMIDDLNCPLFLSLSFTQGERKMVTCLLFIVSRDKKSGREREGHRRRTSSSFYDHTSRCTFTQSFFFFLLLFSQEREMPHYNLAKPEGK